MNINEFIENFAEQFEDLDALSLEPETDYKNLDDWTSLVALSVIAMIDEEYEVEIKGDDIRNTKTINDLFELVKSRK